MPYLLQKFQTAAMMSASLLAANHGYWLDRPRQSQTDMLTEADLSIKK